ncbi:hypothetical protein [Streptomyces sp. NPDC005209]|uniref:hypothetical protein n=1 Tax=Streptomyces sp. NPDC005209 TaxID=3156715 RepID=UPI0033B65F2E
MRRPHGPQVQHLPVITALLTFAFKYRAGIARKRRPYWRTLGTPTTLVLYRTADRWRYAVYFTEPAGITDGALADPVSSSEPSTAQAALLRTTEELTRRQLGVLWRESDRPDWWTGTVTGAGPRPTA